jgi:hypothetical protein
MPTFHHTPILRRNVSALNRLPLAELPRGFTNSVLWPEFLELDRALRDHLQRVTTDMISQAVHADMREADEVPNTQLG